MPTIPRPPRRAALLLCAALPVQAFAQRSAHPAVRQTLAINPLAPPLGFASAEYERAVGRDGFAVGVGALSTLGYGLGSGFPGGDVYRSLEAKLKYFPREDGLRGFAVGVTAGVAHAHTFVSSSTVVTVDEYGQSSVSTLRYDTRTAPTIGATLDYNLLVGRQRRVLIGFGVGAKRTLGARHGNAALDPVLPDPRLQVGFGF